MMMLMKTALLLVERLLPTRWGWGCLLSLLWLELEAWLSCSLEFTTTGGIGWGGVARWMKCKIRLISAR